MNWLPLLKTYSRKIHNRAGTLFVPSVLILEPPGCYDGRVFSWFPLWLYCRRGFLVDLHWSILYIATLLSMQTRKKLFTKPHMKELHLWIVGFLLWKTENILFIVGGQQWKADATTQTIRHIRIMAEEELRYVMSGRMILTPIAYTLCLYRTH